MNPVFGSVVQDDYLALVRGFTAARKHRLEALHTREEAEQYVQQVRSVILRLFPLPPVKSPRKLLLLLLQRVPIRPRLKKRIFLQNRKILLRVQFLDCFLLCQMIF